MVLNRFNEPRAYFEALRKRGFVDGNIDADVGSASVIAYASSFRRIFSDMLERRKIAGGTTPVDVFVTSLGYDMTSTFLETAITPPLAPPAGVEPVNIVKIKSGTELLELPWWVTDASALYTPIDTLETNLANIFPERPLNQVLADLTLDSITRMIVLKRLGVISSAISTKQYQVEEWRACLGKLVVDVMAHMLLTLPNPIDLYQFTSLRDMYDGVTTAFYEQQLAPAPASTTDPSVPLLTEPVVPMGGSSSRVEPFAWY